MQITEILKKIFTDGVLKVLLALCNSVQSVFKYLDEKRMDKKQEEHEKAVEKAEKTIDEACDSGNLDDLVDACIKYGKEKQK